MKILAIDVGTGTQDILIYNDEKDLEDIFTKIVDDEFETQLN